MPKNLTVKIAEKGRKDRKDLQDIQDLQDLQDLSQRPLRIFSPTSAVRDFLGRSLALDVVARELPCFPSSKRFVSQMGIEFEKRTLLADATSSFPTCARSLRQFSGACRRERCRRGWRFPDRNQNWCLRLPVCLPRLRRLP